MCAFKLILVQNCDTKEEILDSKTRVDSSQSVFAISFV